MTENQINQNDDPKPIHESIVDVLKLVKTPDQLEILGEVIKRTKLPKNHDAIMEAYKNASPAGIVDEGIIARINFAKENSQRDTVG